MSEENKDLEASAFGFLQVFQDYDDRTRKELLPIFVRSFNERYHTVKKNYFDKQFIGYVQDQIADLAYNTGSYNSTEKAAKMGSSLGSFLGIIESMAQASGRMPIEEEEIQEAGKILLSAANQIKSALHSINKRIKPRFVKLRVDGIAKRYKGKLSPRTKNLFSDIALIFA